VPRFALVSTGVYTAAIQFKQSEEVRADTLQAS